VQRGALFPEIDANGGFTHAGDGTRVAGATTKGDAASATATLASYEIDLFGRIRGLTAAAKATYLAGRPARAPPDVDRQCGQWLADLCRGQEPAQTGAGYGGQRGAASLTKRRVDGGIGLLADLRKAE
jgi:multidrug efflux system outer membrane protein